MSSCRSGQISQAKHLANEVIRIFTTGNRDDAQADINLAGNRDGTFGSIHAGSIGIETEADVTSKAAQGLQVC